MQTLGLGPEPSPLSCAPGAFHAKGVGSGENVSLYAGPGRLPKDASCAEEKAEKGTATGPIYLGFVASPHPGVTRYPRTAIQIVTKRTFNPRTRV